MTKLKLSKLKGIKQRMIRLYDKLQRMKNSDIWDFEAEDLIKGELVALKQDFVDAGGTKNDFETI